MKFTELSEIAKENARNARRYHEHYLQWGWWDSVYEDAVAVASLLGISIDVGSRTSDRQIMFSGFSSQGDGASFRGTYSFAPEAVQKVTERTGGNDVTLIAIATELTALQIAQRLAGRGYVAFKITTSGFYTHSGTMSLEWYDFYGDDDLSDIAEDKFLALMRRFADWIYKRLEQEYDYHMSDETLDELLADEDFDEAGCVV